MNLLEEAKALPAMPDVDKYGAEDGSMQPDDWWSYWEDSHDALAKRLALAVRALREQADWLEDSGYNDGGSRALADALEVK